MNSKVVAIRVRCFTFGAESVILSVMPFSFLLRSLWYDRWMNTAVVVGVVCAIAVLTGALLVGDSMQGSLKALTLDRLGNIDTILFAPQFINESRDRNEVERPDQPVARPVTPLRSVPGFHSEGVILLPAAVEYDGKISGVQLLGRAPHPSPRQSGSDIPVGEGTKTFANQALADKIGLQPGDTLSLRLMSPQSIPPESSLGRKDQLIRTRINVDEIVPNRGIGRFSLKMDQQAEPLLIVPLAQMQRLLKIGDKVNAVFYKTDSPETLLSATQRKAIKEAFTPSFEDLGINTEYHNAQWYIKSARMLFTDEQVEALLNETADGRRQTVAEVGLLYLATSIRAVKNNRKTPYSTIYATGDPHPNPLPEGEGAENGDVVAGSLLPSAVCRLPSIALNRWTADDLDVEIGDEIELTWFDPDNVAVTHSQTFTLTKILPMEGLGADPHLVPTVEGFTDEASIADWDPPFPFDAKKIRQKDEDYWKEYRAAPKAFASLATGQELFGSRFGKITTIVYQTEPQSLDCNMLRNLKIAALFGLNFVPVKEQGLAASSGTTPFSVLFLAFSFFIIASALMLVMMLFRLSVEMKAERIGILLAVGWTSQQTARLLITEGFLLSLLGSFFGMLLGIGYAAVMIYGLTTWWVGAITVSFLTLHISPISLVIGFISGVCLAMLTIVWSVHGITKVPLRALLHGNIQTQQGARAGNVSPPMSSNRHVQNRRASATPLLCKKVVFRLLAEFFLLLFIVLVLKWNIAFAFFVFGTTILFEGVMWFRTRVQSPPHKQGYNISSLAYASGSVLPLNTINSSLSFAQSNVKRNPTRSLLCVALVASTTFLVLSISAFRLDPLESQKFWRNSSGKYSFIAETMFPVFFDIGTTEGREQLSIQSDDEKYIQEKWFGNNIFSIRMKSGDSTSCLNLYQTGNPRILGLPKSMLETETWFDFAPQPKLWFPLLHPITIDPDGVRRVPVMMDANTAMYALHLYGGIGDVYEYDEGPNGKVRCEIVGLLQNSVLQGEILMSEENLLQLFPEVGGYRYFLFNSPMDDRSLRIVHDLLGDYGFQGEPTADRLRKLFAIQNTYLSTFQSLGGIGLLLGIFGLAVIQSRNVLERRKELALLLAVGFTKSRVILLLLYESFTLLAWGLGLASLASAFALFPFFIGGMQQVSAVSVLHQFVILVGGLLFVGVVSNVAVALAVLKIPVARELAEER